MQDLTIPVQEPLCIRTGWPFFHHDKIRFQHLEDVPVIHEVHILPLVQSPLKLLQGNIAGIAPQRGPCEKRRGCG